jgi:predicted transcriptional regulator
LGITGTIGVTIADTADTTSFTLRLDSELWRRVRLLAARENMSAAQWVREAVRLVVERTEGRGA